MRWSLKLRRARGISEVNTGEAVSQNDMPKKATQAID